MSSPPNRYHGIAIALHWVVAVLILTLLAVGNFFVRLDEADPLRYLLTQWHKSFGVVILVLVLLRLLWRLTHRPPPLPEHLKPWEKRAADLTHLLLYLLILAIPLSGWIMVSASPLELPTLLFNGVEWPHLPPFDTLPGKAAVSEWFASVHEIAGWILVVMLVAHIGAALRHRLVLHDDVMQRMSPRSSLGDWVPGFRSLSLAVVAIVVALIAYGIVGKTAEPLAAGSSQVQFQFTLQGDSSEGSFTDSKVEMTLDGANPSSSSLRATVNTASVISGNSQIDTTLVGSDWFDAKNHPVATFESTAFTPAGQDSYRVSGRLQIRGITREIDFPLLLVQQQDTRMASGEFTVNRLDFDLGADSQADDETVAYAVVVKFAFEVR